jgi:ABC-2 type transport system permease protein
VYKLFVIAYREYVAMVGTKAFLFSLIMMPILMFGSFLLLPTLQKVGGNRELKIVVADGTGVLFEELKKSADAYNESIASQPAPDASDLGMSPSDRYILESSPSSTLNDEDRWNLSESIRQGKIYGFVEIPKSILDKPDFALALDPSAPIADSGSTLATEGSATEGSAKSPDLTKFYSFDSMMSPARRWLSGWLSQKVRSTRIQQFQLDSLDPRILQMVRSDVDVVANRPVEKESPQKDQSPLDAIKAMFLPFGVMMLMFLVIMMAAQPMLESAMEEKSLRISEVLIGAVSPSQLMGGKLLGNVAGSMVIFLLYGCGGLFVLNQQNLMSSLPVSVIPWFILFQILGVLFFSSIFLVVGASVNELKEAQSLLLPVWLMLMAPVMVWFIAVRDPNGLVATTLSFFPPSCPMTMVLRLASGTTVPAWQPALGAIVMLLSTSFMVYLAGRIYRVGLLRTDGVRSIIQLLRRASSQG